MALPNELLAIGDQVDHEDRAVICAANEPGRVLSNVKGVDAALVLPKR